MEYADIETGRQYLWMPPAAIKQPAQKVTVLEVGSDIERIQCGGNEKTTMGTAYPTPGPEEVRVLVQTADGKKFSVHAGELSEVQ